MPRSGGGIYSLPAGSTVANGDTAVADDLNVPLADIEADLNTVRPIVAGGTGASSASAARTALGLAIGTDVQAQNANLASLSGLTLAADRGLYSTAANTLALFTLTAAGRAILDDADAAAQRTTLGLAIGTDVQAYNAKLASLAGLSFSAGDIIYATGANTLQRLAIGTASQQLRVNAGGTALEYFTPSVASSGKTLLGTITTTSGTTQSLTSLALTGYTSLECIINGVSSTGTTGTLRLGNTGGLQISSVLGIGSETWSGQVNIDLATGVATSVVVTSAGSPVSYAAAGASGLSTASTSISFSLSASNNFDAGSIRVYGVP